MELKEMKNTWDDLNKKIEDQESLNTQIIEKMTHQNYHSKLKKIGTSEYVGTIICYTGAAYLSINFTKIGDPFILVLAIVSFLLLLISPIISLQSLRTMRKVNLSSTTYLETIKTYSEKKLRFLKLQKLNILLGMLLMLICLPVLAEIQGKDLGQISNF